MPPEPELTPPRRPLAPLHTPPHFPGAVVPAPVPVPVPASLPGTVHVPTGSRDLDVTSSKVAVARFVVKRCARALHTPP